MGKGDQIMAINILEEQKFDTFEEFWNSISPCSELGRDIKGFIFRGEASKNWKLLPKILRSREDDEDEPRRIYREIKELTDFFMEANYQGLRVPNNKLIHYPPEEIMGTDLFWIRDEFEETVAIAQHYGMPTRLLDWTRDIFVAFYFAAKGVLKIEEKKNMPEPYLIIYALNYRLIKEEMKKWYNTIKNHNRKPFPIKFVLPHYSDNPNIIAQGGILSYSEVNIKCYGDKTWKTDYRPLDERLQELVDDKNHYFHIREPETLLYKFMIPPTEASVMFDFISSLNYSFSRIYPGYAGIMETLKEKNI